MLAPTPVVSHLQNARNLIADPDHWLDGAYSHSSNGHTAWCGLGALREVCWNVPMIYEQTISEYGHAMVVLYQAALDLFGKPPAGVNDQIGHIAILQVFDRAIRVAASGTVPEPHLLTIGMIIASSMPNEMTEAA